MRPRRGWGRWEWLYTTLCVAAFIVCLPVAFPVAMIQHVRAEERKKRRVASAPCVRCGAVLGAAALEKSDAEWSAYLEQLYRDHPGVKFRLVRGVHAVCLACDQQHRYDEASNEFVAADTQWAAERRRPRV